MSTEANKELVRQFVEKVLNEGNLATIPEFFRAGSLLAGHMENLVKVVKGSFPDLSFAIEDMIAEDDKVAVYLVGQGTNHGSFMGQPPTGKEVTIYTFWRYKIADGKIFSALDVTERLEMLQQLGMLPIP
jgi:predicted ester cyclase